MNWQVRNINTGLWDVTAPSGQVFGVFTNEVEARDTPDVLALVRGLGSSSEDENPRVVTRMSPGCALMTAPGPPRRALIGARSAGT